MTKNNKVECWKPKNCGNKPNCGKCQNPIFEKAVFKLKPTA